jgi:hypothetical protein
VFYLRAPSISSRYQLDLAPALAALLLLAWRAVAARWPRAGSLALAALWLTAVATSKITRPKDISDPVDRDRAARAASDLPRPTPPSHPLPGAYDLADPYLAAWTDVQETTARCLDAAGAHLACDAPALPGDVAITGERLGRQWYVARAVIADDAPDAGEPACRADEPVCRAAPTVLTDPRAVITDAALWPPTLYLNGFDWDLTTGRVPPATLFYLDDPAYLALDVAGPPDTDWAHAVRAAIGLDELALVAVAETSTGAHLRFAVSPHPGLVVAFLAFGPDDALDQPRSAFRLRSIRWRD